eukprot:TRINITY_DN2114_c0_g1_i5.p1 TRINITY_DN2114_c0_g1~~TRINITY_DN2114_c0_g1_i5.p1  ORF type:complete len:332 (-),score=72.62 TRINITY_DN2114_c0_g1_i5:246-1241(-)
MENRTPLSGFPYVVSQTDENLTVSFTVPPLTKKKDLNIVIKNNSILAGLKDRTPIVEGTLYTNVRDTLWQIEGTTVTLHLDKDKPAIWPLLISGPLNGSIDPHSSFTLGELMENDIWSNQTRSSEKILEYFRDSADKGSRLGQLRMGHILKGDSKDSLPDITPNPVESLHYYRKAAETWNDADAQYFVAESYREEGEEDEAIKWYKLSAESKNLKSMYRLGEIYKERDDYIEAFIWWNQAASIGHAPSNVSLGHAYWEGNGVQKNLNKALHHFELAYKSDRTKEIPEALLEEIHGPDHHTFSDPSSAVKVVVGVGVVALIGYFVLRHFSSK